MKSLITTFLFLFTVSSAFAQNFADKDYYLVDSLVLSEISFDDSLYIEKGLKAYYAATTDSTKLASIDFIIDHSNHSASTFRYLIVLRNLATEYLNKPNKSEKEKKEIKYFIAISYYMTGFIQNDLGDKVSAKENYLVAKKIFEEADVEWAVAVAYEALGYIENNVEEKLIFFKKALKMHQDIGNEEGETSVLLNLADLSSDLHQKEITFKYLNRAIELAEAYDQKRFLGVALSSLAYNNYRFEISNDNLELYQQSINLLIEVKDYKNASFTLVKLAKDEFEEKKNINQVDSIIRLAITYGKKDNSVGAEANAEYRLATFYLEEEKILKAKELLKKSYIKSKKIENYRVLADVSVFLHEIYAKDKDYKNAYNVLLELYEYDKINLNNKNKLLLSEQNIKYEYEKQKELDDLKNKQKLELAEQQKQKTRLGMIAAGIIALLIGIFSMYTFNRLKLIRNQKTKLDKAYLDLDAAYLKLEESTKNELAVSNLKALKSQMNPHFIFNLLNSIQALVLKGDIDASYTYMTKFATLVRQTLHFSDADLVELEDEIDLLRIYLDLEKLRFSKDFEYQVIDNDIEGIEIPPLLIQPFIENALVHGLLHKEGKKTLKLEFEITDKLVCTITDNGIGRAKSKAIKERQKSNHQSFSTQAIEKRFKILSETYKGQFGFKYEDVFEGDVLVATQVKLHIPYKRVF